jgi:Skp family chaperone for outer membrane proteins
LQFRQSLQAQLNAQLRGKSADQRQQTYTAFNKQLTDEQKKLLQPVLDAQTSAIASVAKKRNLLLVVDAQSKLYGGVDVTADVVKALQ